MPAMRVLIVVLALLSVCGCYEARDPMSGARDDERVVLERITRDPSVRLWRTARRHDGGLDVWTRQGSENVRYAILPDPDQPDELIIVRSDIMRGASIEPGS